VVDAESRFSESARRTGIVGVTLLLAALVLSGLLGVGRAQATVIHKLTATFPATGISTPTSIAYDEESDSVYVMDLFSGQIAKFTSAGAASNFSALGTNMISPACANRCGQITVDNSRGPNQGVIYVGNEINFDSPDRKLYAYLPTGAETEGMRNQTSTLTSVKFCGVATDPQGHVYLGHNNGLEASAYTPFPNGPAHIERFKPGKWLPNEVSPEPQVWPVTGRMYSLPYDSLSNGSQNTCRIGSTSDGDQYFSAPKEGIEGVLEQSPVVRADNGFFDVLPGPQLISVDQANAFTVDQSNDDAYFTHSSESGGSTIVRRNDAGEKLETLGGIVFSAGVAIDDQTGTLYASDAFESNVKVYTTTIGPDIEYGAPSATPTNATVAATIGTAGAGNVTDCKVEYGTSDSYGTTTQCTPDAAGTPFAADTEISADLASLAKEATYHYRVSATNANGTTQGPDQTFRTHNVTELSTEAATAVTRTGATLHGSWIGDGSPTSYFFEWGEDDDYGSVTPTGGPSSTVGPVEVGEAITDLLPASPTHGSYHFRIVATNGEGTSFGEDQVFSTLAPDAPLIDETDVGLVTPTTASVAAAVNPNLGLTFYQFEFGTTTAYGSHTLASAPIGNDDSFHAVGEVLTGLQPSTTYNFRAVATNFGGTTFGPNLSFTTPAAPPPPAAVGPGASSAQGGGSTQSSSRGTTESAPGKKTTKCKKRFVKRSGKCVKKAKKKRKHQRRRSNGHG
jgi:hypothetical protein